MKSLQQLKAEARKSAKAAPKANPKIAAAARAEAKTEGDLQGKSRMQPVYKTQNTIGGTNTHRGVEDPISEFDDPAANIVSGQTR